MGVARKLDKDQEDFESKQLSSLEDIADTKPEEVLAKAVEINLIDVETKEAIDTSMKGHAEIFKKALEKSGTGPGAFKKAFRSVYGRFLMERGPKIVKNDEGKDVIAEGELEHENGDLMKVLDKVLKFKVDPKLGLKGRSELQAVVRRLKDVTAGQGVREKYNADIVKLAEDKAKHEAKKAELEPENAALVKANDITNGLSRTDINLDELDEIDEHNDQVDDRIKFIKDDEGELQNELSNKQIDKGIYVSKIANLRNGLSEFRDTIAAYNFDASKISEIDNALNALELILTAGDFNYETWLLTLENTLKPLFKKINSRSYLKAEKSYPDSKKAYGDEILRRQVEGLNFSEGILRSTLPLLSSYYDTHRELADNTLQGSEFEAGKQENEAKKQEITEKVIGQLDESALEIEKLKNPELESLVSGIGGKCDKYLSQLAALKANSAEDRPALIRAFINTVYKPFIAEIYADIAKSLSANTAELAEAQKFLNSYADEAKRLKDFKSPSLKLKEILERAFGVQKTSDEMKKLEDHHHHVEHTKADLVEDKKYFGGDDVKNIHKKYKELLGSDDPSKIGVDAASAREKKAAMDAKNEEKGKLEEVKTLFGEKKLGEVQDKFLELDGLLTGYLLSGDGDFESKLADKKSEADLLKGTVDNYEKTGKPLLVSNIQQEKANLNRLSADPKVEEYQKEAVRETIRDLERELEKKEGEFTDSRSELKKLTVAISQLEKFKDTLKAFRTDILDLARGCEKAIGLGVFDLGGATKVSKLKEIVSLKNYFNGLNVNSIEDLGKLKSNYQTLSGGFSSISSAAEKTLKGAGYGIDEQQALNDESGKIEKAKALYESLGPLVARLVKSAHHGVKLGAKPQEKKNKDAEGKVVMETEKEAEERLAHDIEKKFAALTKPDHKDFKVKDVAVFYNEYLLPIIGDEESRKVLNTNVNSAITVAEEKVKKSEKDLKAAKEGNEKSKDLSDAQAARKIIGALVAEQFPDLSPMDHNKLVTMILADDVATLLTDEGYEGLAQRATAEKSEAASFAGFRTKLLNFKYKEGDKVNQPFKGLKPEDFESWEKMDKLFTFGKLNYEKGTFVLAAFEDFDNGTKSIQSVKLEKKLRALLAKKLGVDTHMDNAGIAKVVDDAFKAQMEKVRPIMKAHAEMAVGEKGKKARENKKNVLNMKYDDLNDQFKSGKITGAVYDHKLEALVKEAKESEVDVEFSADSVGAKYWNSPYAQWLKDKAHDAGSFVGKKALAAGVFAPLKIAGKGVWGATKLGTALGFQTALLPVRAAKYPLLLAAKPLVGFINLFRANKWTPLPGIRDSVKNDTARIMGYAKGKASGVMKGTAETVTSTVSGEWGKVKYADTKYEDRNKKKSGERAELMKIHEPKSDLEAIEVPDSPFVDLAKYKKQIDMVATALGIKIDAPHGAEVKVGHEEKKDEHAKPHDAAHGAHDAHAEKVDAHAKPDDHKKAA
ncbi:MAG: hypothetical protein NTZ25_03165 [Candidatus Peregrinibacteria bacterium]|nr:hypothetical protein [Candidatus Peregrinibacteria bacterium]